MNEYKIGNINVSKEIYIEFLREKNKLWKKMFPYSFLLCFLVMIFVMFFWIKICKIDIESIKEKGYLEACQDFYNGKLKYDLITKKNGIKEWKKL